ncbi:MAG: hypothetical protein IRZ13_13625 [Acetobacteraceae bacterium]|nr:hypothetical protein [Acetobacteraceae bacterium]
MSGPFAVRGFGSREWARRCVAFPAARPEDTDDAALDPRRRQQAAR